MQDQTHDTIADGPGKAVNKCAVCGEPMPDGEQMFKYHGYSGPCPKPPLPKDEPVYTPPPITGYRQLTQGDVDDMNELKALGNQIDAVIKRIERRNLAVTNEVHDAYAAICDAHVKAGGSTTEMPGFGADLTAKLELANRSQRSLAVGKTQMQGGLMWVIRGIANPDGF